MVRLNTGEDPRGCLQNTGDCSHDCLRRWGKESVAYSSRHPPCAVLACMTDAKAIWSGRARVDWTSLNSAGFVDAAACPEWTLRRCRSWSAKTKMMTSYGSSFTVGIGFWHLVAEQSGRWTCADVSQRCLRCRPSRQRWTAERGGFTPSRFPTHASMPVGTDQTGLEAILDGMHRLGRRPRLDISNAQGRERHVAPMREPA